ncbi:MAG: DNA-directed RNA polymerase subunit omega [Epulopiscium sp.]|nr:DNA-directed RNA polymerase subunit omega [Candidatus Epulonipiscium sp.]
MLKPSYTDLMEKLNQNSSDEDKPIVSRYSIVIAAAKRARQIVDKGDSLLDSKVDKPVSIAVKELYQGKVVITNKITPPDTTQDIDTLSGDSIQNHDMDEDIESSDE